MPRKAEANLKQNALSNAFQNIVFINKDMFKGKEHMSGNQGHKANVPIVALTADAMVQANIIYNVKNNN